MQNKFLGTGQKGFHPIRKIIIAFSGIRYAFRYDFAVTYKAALSVIVLIWCFIYRQWLDFSIVFVSTGLMMISEMFNTTVEALCDFLEPKENEKIAIIKDIAAASAGLSILIWAVILIIEVLRFWQFVK
ncbi:MAG: diacylglycerol kinase [Desulfobacterales bacterium]